MRRDVRDPALVVQQNREIDALEVHAPVHLSLAFFDLGRDLPANPRGPGGSGEADLGTLQCAFQES